MQSISWNALLSWQECKEGSSEPKGKRKLKSRGEECSPRTALSSRIPSDHRNPWTSVLVEIGAWKKENKAYSLCQVGDVKTQTLHTHIKPGPSSVQGNRLQEYLLQNLTMDIKFPLEFITINQPSNGLSGQTDTVVSKIMSKLKFLLKTSSGYVQNHSHHSKTKGCHQPVSCGPDKSASSWPLSSLAGAIMSYCGFIVFKPDPLHLRCPRLSLIQIRLPGWNGSSPTPLSPLLV